MMRELGLSDLGPLGRAVVIAPHPDDEVFGVGGLMAILVDNHYQLDVVAVTDGEASHALSKCVTPQQVRQIRLEETGMAYQHLGISPERCRLRLPDSNVSCHADALRELLATRLDGASVVIAPLETDGHPDHDVTGRIAREVATRLGLTIWRYAVWAHLHPERITQGQPSAFRLSPEVRDRKARAVDTFVSQFNPLGPLPEDGPVLPGNFREHFVGDLEYLWPTR